MVKYENFQKRFFFLILYINLSQNVKQYVSIPEIISFEHLWPFLRKRPQKTSKIIFCPKSYYFSFSLGHFEHTYWTLCVYAQNCDFRAI